MAQKHSRTGGIVVALPGLPDQPQSRSVSFNPGDMRPKFDLLTELEANAGAHTVTAETPGRPLGTRSFPREPHS